MLPALGGDDHSLAPLHDGMGHAPDPPPTPTQAPARSRGQWQISWASLSTVLTCLWLLVSGKGWQGGRLGGARGTREQESMAKNQSWAGSGREDWVWAKAPSSGLIHYCSVGLHLQSTSSKIKLLRISHSTALNLKQGAPVQLPWSHAQEAGPDSES